MFWHTCEGERGFERQELVKTYFGSMAPRHPPAPRGAVFFIKEFSCFIFTSPQQSWRFRVALSEWDSYCGGHDPLRVPALGVGYRHGDRRPRAPECERARPWTQRLAHGIGRVDPAIRITFFFSFFNWNGLHIILIKIKSLLINK